MTKDEIEKLKREVYDLWDDEYSMTGPQKQIIACDVIDYLAERGLLGGGQEWNNLYETMPPVDKEFVCRHKYEPHIQFEAIITMESEGYFSADGGKPYPVLWDAKDDQNILAEPWNDYEWMPLPAAPKHDGGGE